MPRCRRPVRGRCPMRVHQSRRRRSSVGGAFGRTARRFRVPCRRDTCNRRDSRSSRSPGGHRRVPQGARFLRAGSPHGSAVPPVPRPTPSDRDSHSATRCSHTWMRRLRAGASTRHDDTRFPVEPLRYAHAVPDLRAIAPPTPRHHPDRAGDDRPARLRE